MFRGKLLSKSEKNPKTIVFNDLLKIVQAGPNSIHFITCDLSICKTGKTVQTTVLVVLISIFSIIIFLLEKLGRIPGFGLKKPPACLRFFSNYLFSMISSTWDLVQMRQLRTLYSLIHFLQYKFALDIKVGTRWIGAITKRGDVQV